MRGIISFWFDGFLSPPTWILSLDAIILSVEPKPSLSLLSLLLAPSHLYHPSSMMRSLAACGRVGVYLVCPVDRCVSQYDNHVSLSRLEMKRRVHRGSGVRWVQPVRGHRYIVVFERGREDGRTGNILWKKCLITKSPGVEGVPFLPPHISYLNRPFS